MRNLSMKKFGTPTTAGPGDAIEVVGFCANGRPTLPGSVERSGTRSPSLAPA
jgi:hypothetical protein